MLSMQSLRHLLDILEEDVQYLWYEQRVEEDFVRTFVRTGFDMLENPANARVAEVKEMLFMLLQKTMERFGGEVKYM